MKKTLSIILTLAMLVSMFAALAVNTSAAVVECASWADVVAAFTADNTASVKLTADVTADATVAVMAGTFDGNGYTVTIAPKTHMFKVLTGNATLKNFQTKSAEALDRAPIADRTQGECNIVFENVINNVDVVSQWLAGGFIGVVDGTVKLTMSACINNGDIHSTGNQVGGFIGNGEGSLEVAFTDVVNNGNVTGNKNYVGGILNTNGTITGTMLRVVNNGDVLCESADNGSNAAGIMGTIKGLATVTLTDCVNTGDIKLISNKSGDLYGAAAFAMRTDHSSSVLELKGCINTGTMTAPDGTTADALICPKKGGTATAENCLYIGGTTYLTEGVTLVSEDAAVAAIEAIEAQMATPRFGTTVTDLSGNSRLNVAVAAVAVTGINKDGDATASTHAKVIDGTREYLETSDLKTYLNKNHKDKETGFAVKTDAGDKTYRCLVVLEFGEEVSVDGFTVFAGGYKEHVLDDAADILVSADGENWEIAWSGTELVSAQKWAGADYTKEDESGLTANAVTATINGDFAKQYDNIKYVAYATVTPRENQPGYFIRMTEFEVYGSIGAVEVVVPETTEAPAVTDAPGEDTTVTDPGETGDNAIFVVFAIFAVGAIGTAVISRKREQN